ncbi:hypothetical protein PRZ48_009068 [Zasmidium cellare]|uniref:Uncharacterized protein n=1 Tax=Zasmidium cellare TaxID=395010 RepID=A0ABR0EI09_ZASCE|nr:hypothetical protein PRZ48_009068 [Zasmidium cellare]
MGLTNRKMCKLELVTYLCEDTKWVIKENCGVRPCPGTTNAGTAWTYVNCGEPHCKKYPDLRQADSKLQAIAAEQAEKERLEEAAGSSGGQGGAQSGGKRGTQSKDQSKSRSKKATGRQEQIVAKETSDEERERHRKAGRSVPW